MSRLLTVFAIAVLITAAILAPVMAQEPSLTVTETTGYYPDINADRPYARIITLTNNTAYNFTLSHIGITNGHICDWTVVAIPPGFFYQHAPYGCSNAFALPIWNTIPGEGSYPVTIPSGQSLVLAIVAGAEPLDWGTTIYGSSYDGATPTPTATGEPTATPGPTATPAPTTTPEPYNEWGRALSETARIADFNTTMAAANGGTPLDMTPYEIPTPSASLPALTLSVADLNTMGKSATTLWALLDQFNVLPFYFLIAIALAVVWWFYRFITDLPTPTPDWDITGAVDVGTGFDDMDIESGLAAEEQFRATNNGYGYDDSLARTDALKDRKTRNAERRRITRGGVSLIRRTKNLF